jgi:hypothetical protein
LTIQEWANNNYSPLKDACRRIAEGNALSEELLHYVLSEFLVKPDVEKIVSSGGAFFFCLRKVKLHITQTLDETSGSQKTKIDRV